MKELLQRILATGWLNNELSCEVEELLTQPEPFMFKGRELTGSLIAHDDMYKKGYAQAEFHLKREPLTPQQISVGNQSTLNVTRDAFKQGVKYAEKAHGIGGEE